MGIFDFLRGGDGPSPSQIQKAIKQVTQPHGDPSVRLAALDRLKEWGTEDAIAALLRRFTIQTPSGQMDLEECQEVERMLVDCGEAAVKPILRFLERESSVAYPARALSQILPADKFVGEILGVLEKLEAGFGSQDEQRSGLIRALDDLDDPSIAEGMLRFLGDPNDDVALSALECVVKSADTEHRTALVEQLEATGDRPRVRQAVAEGLVSLGWPMQEHRKRVEECLPEGFALDNKGRVVHIR